jgi:hypothetical protein
LWLLVGWRVMDRVTRPRGPCWGYPVRGLEDLTKPEM